VAVVDVHAGTQRAQGGDEVFAGDVVVRGQGVEFRAVARRDDRGLAGERRFSDARKLRISSSERWSCSRISTGAVL
jgi:hypothetical protein